MFQDPSTSDSDAEYHTCDEDDDDEGDDDRLSGVRGAAPQSSSSSDDGIDYHHSSDDDTEEELDVLGAAAPALSVKKETHQMYTSKITGLDQHVQEILEACGQTKRNRHLVSTQGARQDDDTLAIVTSQLIPIPGSQPTETSLAVTTLRSQQDDNTLTIATPQQGQCIPSPGSQPTETSTAVTTLRSQQDDDTLAAAGGGYNALVQLNVSVTQQQFGDVTVEKATNINQSFGGKQNISKTASYHEESKASELSRCDIIMKRTVEHFKVWNQGMVKTAALVKVLGKLENGATWLTIKGNPGEGKTTVAYMALEELHRRGRQVFDVRTPEEFSEVISTSTSPVIMLDDVFGNLEFDQSKWSSWEPAVSPLLKKREHKSHEKKENSPELDVTVILVGRDYVLNSASGDLGRLSDFLTSDNYAIFMDHSMQRDIEEKCAIWESISRSSGVKLGKHTVDKLLRIDVAHGFPHVCRLFVTLHEENKDIQAEEFFKKPLEFLNISISNLFKDTNKLLLFKEMVKNEGKVCIREVRKLDPTYKVIQAAKNMVGSYLRIEGDFYLFDHPSIYDSVAFNLCLLDPVFVIQQCHMAFIHERVRLQMAQNTSSAARLESSLVVYVDSSYSDELAERFSAEIVNNSFRYVLSHQACTDASFVKKMMSYVSMPLQELIDSKRHRRFSLTYNSFLSWVPSSKSPELLKYLDDCPEIKLSEYDEKAILFGTCKHAALEVLKYLINTRSSLDINVRFNNFVVFVDTPLTLAAKTGDIQFIQQVLSLKPNLNVIPGVGKSALHYLCMKGLVSIVTQMIDSGADIDIEDLFEEKTPLFLACERNQLGIVRLLIERGARVDETTLNAAHVGGNPEIVEMVLEKVKSMNNEQTLGNSSNYRHRRTLNLFNYFSREVEEMRKTHKPT